MLRDAQPALLISTEELAPELRDCCSQLLCLTPTLQARFAARPQLQSHSTPTAAAPSSAAPRLSHLHLRLHRHAQGCAHQPCGHCHSGGHPDRVPGALTAGARAAIVLLQLRCHGDGGADGLHQRGRPGGPGSSGTGRGAPGGHAGRAGITHSLIPPTALASLPDLRVAALSNVSSSAGRPAARELVARWSAGDGA